MKPYKLIHGSSEDITTFENEICDCLSEGYEFANRLITKVVTNQNGMHKVFFFQPMIFADDVDEIYDEDEDELE